ncbi:MAG: 2-methylfumaryl-CoA hydratase [Candidatus Azotimanducaceae bacterium]
MIPWFEDFAVGDDFSNVPSVTITEGFTAIHQAIFGDRLKLPLNYVLSEKVTGSKRPLVNPSLVCNLAIGQSTIPSQRVMGNLFYRGLILRQPVFLGDTLTTTTRVVALRQNKIKEGRPASGMVALEIHTKNQNDETVLLFWRCPMIPCRDANANTGHFDDFDVMPEHIQMEDLLEAVPAWKFEHVATAPLSVTIGEKVEIEARDTVTLAPELVRLTQNLAMTHTDAGRSVYGKRLVYGGHTISMAAAQLSRAMPNLITLLGWYHCDHTSPVFEGDVLRASYTLQEQTPVNGASLLKLHVEVFASRGEQAPKPDDNVKVLDWSLAALTA